MWLSKKVNVRHDTPKSLETGLIVEVHHQKLQQNLPYLQTFSNKHLTEWSFGIFKSLLGKTTSQLTFGKASNHQQTPHVSSKQRPTGRTPKSCLCVQVCLTDLSLSKVFQELQGLDLLELDLNLTRNSGIFGLICEDAFKKARSFRKGLLGIMFYFF